MRPVVVDTDGGVDDAAALWWALTDPRLNVLAITCVWGNVPVEVAAGNVLAVLAAAGRDDVPVAIGEPGPLGPAPTLGRPNHVHGQDGLGGTGRSLPVDDVRRDGVDVLRELARRHAGHLTVLTLGPLTNVARALEDPAFAADVAELVVMGGVIHPPGNALPLGESNIAHDPLAAATVVRAGWRTPPLLVGLDVTLVATLSPEELTLLRLRRSPAAAFLDEPIRYYAPYGGARTAPNCPCHDLVAMLAVSDPALITDAPVVPLAVDVGRGAAWGATIADLRPGAEVTFGFSPWRIALGVDVDRFRRYARQLFS